MEGVRVRRRGQKRSLMRCVCETTSKGCLPEESVTSLLRRRSCKAGPTGGLAVLGCSKEKTYVSRADTTQWRRRARLAVVAAPVRHAVPQGGGLHRETVRLVWSTQVQLGE